MKKYSFFLKFSATISIIVFFLIILILNFIIIPQSFETFSQINCFNQEENNFCSLMIIFNQEQKNKVNNQIIIIYFVTNQEYKKVVANNWIDKQLIIIETNKIIGYANQKVIITYNYESLFSYLLNNVY